MFSSNCLNDIPAAAWELLTTLVTLVRDAWLEAAATAGVPPRVRLVVVAAVDVEVIPPRLKPVFVAGVAEAAPPNDSPVAGVEALAVIPPRVNPVVVAAVAVPPRPKPVLAVDVPPRLNPVVAADDVAAGAPNESDGAAVEAATVVAAVPKPNPPNAGAAVVFAAVGATEAIGVPEVKLPAGLAPN